MTPPDGSAVEAFGALESDAPATTVGLFPGAFQHSPAGDAGVGAVAGRLPDDLAAARADRATARGVAPAALLAAARLLCGGDEPGADVRAAELALAAAGRGPCRLAPTAEIERLQTRIETLEYRGRGVGNAPGPVGCKKLDGGIRDVRDAAQMFGFANEWCFDEHRVTRRFRELAPVYHPDTGVVADRERMTQLIEARNLLIRHVRTAYPAGRWTGKRRE